MLTLVVITLNEADRLANCLGSVPMASQILVVDSGSTDDTVAVARALGAHVVELDWPGHVAQKNRALALARTPWVLSLDADEALDSTAQVALSAFLKSPGAYHGASFSRCSHYRGKPVRHGRWYPDRKIRLVRRGRGAWGGDDPHDQLCVEGPVQRLDGDILHHPYRSDAEHLDTIRRYTEISAQALHRRGVRGGRVAPVVRPVWHMVDALLVRRGILDGRVGVELALHGALYTHRKWRRLRELSR